jgi:hypothetical protein
VVCVCVCVCVCVRFYVEGEGGCSQLRKVNTAVVAKE